MQQLEGQAGAETDRGGAIDRLFAAHPRSLGMSWWSHGAGAIAIGGTLIAAGAACLVHAIVPAWFTQTAGRTISRMHDHMTSRRAGAADPNAWPEYEI